MRWIDVHLIERGELKENASGAASVTYTYWAESDEPMTQDAALAAVQYEEDGESVVSAIPQRGQGLSDTRPSCACVERRVEWISPKKFRVACDFADPATGGGTGENLLAKAAVISRGDETASEAYQVDATGQNVLNAAGEIFDNPPQRQTGVVVYTVRKYVDAEAAAEIEGVRNTNNAAPVTIKGLTWDTDELWMSGLTLADVDGVEGVQEAVMTIKGKVGGWADRPLNVGFRDADGHDILNADGEPVSKPWPLDESGAAKTGTPPAVDALEFWPYDQADWSGVPVA